MVKAKKAVKSFACVFLLMAAAVFQAIIVYGADARAEFYLEQPAGTAGETVTVTVHTNKIKNVGGILLDLSYDTEKLTYQADSFTPALSDMSVAEKEGTLTAAWDTADSNTTFEGVIFSAQFKLKEDVKEGRTVRLTIKELYDATPELHNIRYSVIDSEEEKQFIKQQGNFSWIWIVLVAVVVVIAVGIFIVLSIYSKRKHSKGANAWEQN